MGKSTINADLRKSLVKRVDGICAVCLRRPYDLDAHRIVPGHEGGEYTEDNIIMVCPECHRTIDKQVGLRRFLIDLRGSLEWFLSQHRLPGGKIRIGEIRDHWKCRRIRSSKDPLLEDTLGLFKEFREDENEDLSSIGVWLDDMITWRRLCTWLLNLCIDEKTEIDQVLCRLKNVMDYNEGDPRYSELAEKLASIENKDQLHLFIRNEILRLEDYLIVQRSQNEVIGFIYFHYYYKCKYAFVSYVVLAKPNRKYESRPYRSSSLDRLVFNGLLRNLIKNHPECEGVIMEIDPEDRLIVRKAEQDINRKLERKRGRGLYRLFHEHYPMLKRVGINYVQPKSFVHSKRDEKGLWLLYYPLKATNDDYISKSTVDNMLDCVYNYLYRDELDNLKEFDVDIFTSYSNYLSDLKNRTIQGLPARIPLI